MFDLFKFGSKKNKNKDFEVNIYAPLSGKVIPIEEVDDPVFAQKAVGDGMAIYPSSDTVVSPFAGIIKMVHGSKHAIIVQGDNGIEILIHIGIDTVELNGQGFTCFVEVGQKVKKGENLIQFDMEYVKKHAKSLQSMVIVANLGENFINKSTNQEVKAGSDILYAVSNKKKNLN